MSSSKPSRPWSTAGRSRPRRRSASRSPCSPTCSPTATTVPPPRCACGADARDGGRCRCDPLGNDRFTATFVPDRLGRWQYQVVGWLDHLGTWRHGMELKLDAGGRRHRRPADRHRPDRRRAGRAATGTVDADGAHRARASAWRPATRARSATSPSSDERTRRRPRARTSTTSSRSRTGPTSRRCSGGPGSASPSASWPDRSTSRSTPSAPGSARGTSSSPARRSPPVDGPRHARRRRRPPRLRGVDGLRRPVPAADPPDRRDPAQGSQQHDRRRRPTTPAARGRSAARDGGHTEVHPELGTVDDVVKLAAACHDAGHRAGPRHRLPVHARPPVGHRAPVVVRPPSRRHDPVRREPAEEVPGHLPARLRERRLAGSCGTRSPTSSGSGSPPASRVFRVDNPHTKAFAFWEWVIPTIRAEHPEAIFLAEAFTRPRVMERLAKVGFNQSYTYFTWRQSAWELRTYFEELSTRTVDYMRPNVWPNTPDILTEQLQTGGPGDVRHPGHPRRHAVAGVGRVRPGVRAARAPARACRARRSTSTRRSTSCASGTSTAPTAWRRCSAGSTASAASSRRSPTCARCASTTRRATRCSATRRRDPAGTGPPVLVVVNLDADQRQAGFVDVDLAPSGCPYESRYDVVDQLSDAQLPLARRRGTTSSSTRPPPPTSSGWSASDGPRRAGGTSPEGAHDGATPTTDSRVVTASAPPAARRRSVERRLAGPGPPGPARHAERATLRASEASRTGTATRSSTSSTSGPSPTPTATASATSTASPSASTTSPTSASRRSGCCRSTRRRCATTATTSPTTARSTPTTATCASSSASSPPPTTASIRVITELVVNHTSDQHPWFQRARHAPTRLTRAGLLRVERPPDRYADARVIFQDFEASNWTWDPVAEAYFWHRFYSHQPDLNYDNPDVEAAVFDVARLLARHGRRRAAPRRRAVPLRARGHELREPARDPRGPEAAAQAHGRPVPGPHAARRGQPVARGRRRLLRRRRRVPHELPLPGDAAAVHVAAPRAPHADRRHHGADARAAARRAVGDVPAQPRRADAGDGHRRGARPDAPRLRHRPRDAHQPRHPPPPGAAARQRPPQDRAAQRAAVLAARHARHLLRRRDRDGRQRLPRRPQRRAHADAVDGRPQRRVLDGQPAPPVPAADHRAGLPLRVGQRGDAGRQPGVAAVVDAPADRPAQAPPACSAGARSSSSSRRTPTCWRSCATRRRRWTGASSRCCASPTCRASPSRSSSTCASSPAPCPSRCSARTASRP